MDIYELAAAYREALLQRERAAASALVRAYAEVWHSLRVQLDDLLAQIVAARADGTAVNPLWLYQQQRLPTLQNQAERALAQWLQFADATIQAEQAAVVALAEQHAEQLMLAGFGPVPDTVDSTLTFARLPQEAIVSLVGFLADGSPLRDLLATLGPAAHAQIESVLITGLATGQGPRQIATQLRASLGGNLARALTIARTETLRAARTAAYWTYQRNSDVISGWTWSAKVDRHTCSICWAMHGTIHPLWESFASHPNCRCAMLPRTKSWEELGFAGVVDTRPEIETGVDRFDQLSAAKQRAILGPGKYVLYRDGLLTLAELVGRRYDPKWGSMRFEKSLRAVS